MELEELPERLVVGGLRARVGLGQRLHRLVHQGERDPLAVRVLAHDRAVRCAVGRERARGHPVRALVRHRDRGLLHGQLLAAVLVDVAVAALLHRLQEFVGGIHRARRVHPADALVEALVDEELAPGGGAVRVESLVARHLELGSEVERRVRVDQEQRMAGRRVRRGDRHPVRPARFDRPLVLDDGGFGAARLAVERLELVEIDLLDVAANAAFGEAQRHPRFEMRNDPRLHGGMRGEVVVEAVRERVHQLLQRGRARRVLLLEYVGIDVELHPQVLVDSAFAFGLGQPAHRVDVVGLDAVEIVFGLRVLRAEHRVRVGLAVDVRDAPVVPHDRHVLRLLLPARHVR